MAPARVVGAGQNSLSHKSARIVRLIFSRLELSMVESIDFSKIDPLQVDFMVKVLRGCVDLCSSVRTIVPADAPELAASFEEARAAGAKALEKEPVDVREVYVALQEAVAVLKPASLVLPHSTEAMNILSRSMEARDAIVEGRRGALVIQPKAAADLYYALEDLLRFVNDAYSVDMEKPSSRLKALADAAGVTLRLAKDEL